MAIFVGGSAGVGVDSGASFGDALPGGFASTYAPSQPAFWSLVILALLIVAVVVIAHGAR